MLKNYKYNVYYGVYLESLHRKPSSFCLSKMGRHKKHSEKWFTNNRKFFTMFINIINNFFCIFTLSNKKIAQYEVDHGQELMKCLPGLWANFSFEWAVDEGWQLNERKWSVNLYAVNGHELLWRQRLGQFPSGYYGWKGKFVAHRNGV